MTMTMMKYSLAGILAHTRSYSENVAGIIDEEVKESLMSAMQKQREFFENIKMFFISCAKLLIEKERIGRKNLKLYSKKQA